jgi:hypothetical protein
MKPTIKRPKDWLRFFWVIFDTSVRKEYYLDVHNILAQPVGSIIRYNYRRKYCTDAAWEEIQKVTLGHDVLLAYTQYAGFERGKKHDDPKQFPEGTPMWSCPTRLARMVGISVNGDQVYFDLMLGDYPKPGTTAFDTLMKKLEDRKEVPFKKFVAIHSEWGVFDSVESPDPSGSKENWSAIATQLDRHSQFKGDSFWRIVGPFRRGSNELIPYRRLKLRDSDLYQLHFRDSEVAYVQVQNQESRSKPAGADVTTRTLKIAVSDPSLQVRETVMQLRQYFETTLFFRAKKQESLRPAEPVIEFTTEGEKSDYHLGASFKLPISVGLNWTKVVVGVVAAFTGAILATIALKDKLTYREVAMFGVALVLLSIGSVLLQDKIKIGSGGGD